MSFGKIGNFYNLEKVYTGRVDIFDSGVAVPIFTTLTNCGYFIPQYITYSFVSRGTGGTGSAAPQIRCYYGASTSNLIAASFAVSSATPALGQYWNPTVSSPVAIAPNTVVYIKNDAVSDSFDSWIIRYVLYGVYTVP